jgi:hypothetical protein
LALPFSSCSRQPKAISDTEITSRAMRDAHGRDRLLELGMWRVADGGGRT